MSDELIGFFIGMSATLVSVTGVLLFNALAERANKRRAKKEQPPQSHASKTAAPIKTKSGYAKEPSYEHGSRASCSQIHDNVFEKHRTPNVQGKGLAATSPTRAVQSALHKT